MFDEIYFHLKTRRSAHMVDFLMTSYQEKMFMFAL